jgi:hypothetical protein
MRGERAFCVAKSHQAMSDRATWLILFLLGCYHGVNPGMGWLFAVALGLQERSTRAVLGAVVPMGIGHVASISIVVALALFAAQTLPHEPVHRGAAALLFAFGAYRLVRARHPRWVGMRVGFLGLALWGFVMATAHGAGLMLLPFVTALPSVATSGGMAMPMPAAPAVSQTALNGVLMVAAHTSGYLLVTALVAFIVYRKLGLSFLRTAWFNVDAAWAAALIVTGSIALFT